MGRPTIYGKEIRVDNEDNCIGINIGYNFYSEHEGDTRCIVDKLNKELPRSLTFLKTLGTLRYRKEIKQISKEIEKNEKAISIWKNTPFIDSVLVPTTRTWLKMVVIDNSEVRTNYTNVLLQDGHYYLLIIGNGLTHEYWEQKFGKKKTVSEKDLFYMEDYQRMCRNTGYILNNGCRLQQQNNFAASWSLTDDAIMILLPEQQKHYLEDIQTALKNGYLACVTQEPRMFKDRGCCLINLEAAYRPRL